MRRDRGHAPLRTASLPQDQDAGSPAIASRAGAAKRDAASPASIRQGLAARQTLEAKIARLERLSDPKATCPPSSTGARRRSPRCLAAGWTPWGKAADLELWSSARRWLKAMTEPKYEVVLPEQKVRCKLEQKSERRALWGRHLDRAESRVRERQGGLGKAQLGRGESAHAHLCPDLCRNRTR